LKISASKFAILPELIYLFPLLPKKLYVICSCVKIDHAQAWKISYQPSSVFSQELKTTPLTEYCREQST